MNTNAEPKSLLAPVGMHDVVVIVMLGLLLDFGLSGFADAPMLGRELLNGSRVMSALSGDLSIANSAIDFAPGWLGHVVLWVLYSAGSWPLLYGFLVACFALAYLLLLYRVVGTASCSYILTSLGVVGTFLVVLPGIRAGEALLELLLLVVLFAILLRWYTNWRERTPHAGLIPRPLWVILPAISVLWVNLGAGFLAGLLLLALVPVAIRYDAVSNDTSPDAVSRSWGLLVLVCVLCSLLNPIGPEAFRVGWAALGTSFDAGGANPAAFQRVGFSIGLSLVLIFVGTYISREARDAIGVYPILCVAAFALLGLARPGASSLYHTVALLPLVAVVVGTLKLKFGAVPPGEGPIRTIARLIEARERRSLRGGAVLSALLLIVLVDCTVNQKLILYAGPFGPDRERFPYAAVEVLRESWSEEGQAVVATIPQWSGFVAFAGAGLARPLFDDRPLVVQSKAYLDFQRTLRPGGAWEQYLRDHGATHMLLPRQDPLAMWVRESGEAFPLHEDNQALLFDVRSMRQVSEHALE